MFMIDETLNEIVKHKEIDFNAIDGSCTDGFDNNGSTGFEIFENGFELAHKARNANKLVWRIILDDDGISIFMIGSLEEVRKRLEAMPDVRGDNKTQVDTDDDDESTPLGKFLVNKEKDNDC